MISHEVATKVSTQVDNVLDTIRRRDDLLALLYWLHADRLNDSPAAADLVPFLGATAHLEQDLHALVESDLVRPVDGATRRYRLTSAGLAEGKRRFEEEFSPAPDDGTAGNAHEVMIGICGPNAKCVRDGTHGECVEPAPAARAGPRMDGVPPAP